MNKSTVLNLDYEAAGVAQKIIAEVRSEDQSSKKSLVDLLGRVVTKTLGVLQSQGIYAMELFLLSRGDKEKDVAMIIEKHLRESVSRVLSIKNITRENPENCLTFYRNLLTNISTMFLVRDFLELTLIYTRYGAKSIS
ncbi:MAG: hypothetical protein K9W43_12690 [Candidatus Thorarchaeota archaeon]|nr:hypothetical protein [Candidatus Thorarchaeota archaeon]